MRFATTNHVDLTTYGTFFVLMVLAITSVRTVGVIVRPHRQGAHPCAAESRIARRFIHA
ncbi:MAG: hypothetical protein ACXVHB_11010 [Solirubrobacteraceae bacterium]